MLSFSCVRNVTRRCCGGGPGANVSHNVSSLVQSCFRVILCNSILPSCAFLLLCRTVSIIGSRVFSVFSVTNIRRRKELLWDVGMWRRHFLYGSNQFRSSMCTKYYYVWVFINAGTMMAIFFVFANHVVVFVSTVRRSLDVVPAVQLLRSIIRKPRY